MWNPMLHNFSGLYIWGTVFGNLNLENHFNMLIIHLKCWKTLP